MLFPFPLICRGKYFNYISTFEEKEFVANTGFTIWFTGLSGAGKSTLSEIIEKRLNERGRNVEVLDGDVVRTHLSKGLGFSREDRDTNIKRIGFVCGLLSRNNVICISAAIAPYAEAREWARNEIGSFVEVYIKCPIEVCRERDVKGLYKLVDEGKIKNFTGVDDPYEEPEHPELVIETDRETIEESVSRIFAKLVELGYLEDEGNTEDEAKVVTERLAALGYL
ncbi:MAG TPA: adenylyl-sulfate kinase [Ktedonobacteraceae bacterium]